MQAKNDEKRKRARDRKMIRDGEYTNTKLNYIFFRSVKWSLMVPRWTSFWRDTQTIFDNIQILILFIFIFAVFECSFICNDMKKSFFFVSFLFTHSFARIYYKEENGIESNFFFTSFECVLLPFLFNDVTYDSFFLFLCHAYVQRETKKKLYQLLSICGKHLNYSLSASPLTRVPVTQNK